MERRAQVAVEEATRLAARDRFEEALQLLAEPMLASQPAVEQARVRIESAREEFEGMRADAVARHDAERGETVRLDAERAEAARRDADRLQAARLEAKRQEAARIEAARLEPSRADAAHADAVRRQAFEAPTLLGVVAEPPRSFAPLGGLGFLPGPVRTRRPKPPRRPVIFLDAAPEQGGAREWFHD